MPRIAALLQAAVVPGDVAEGENDVVIRPAADGKRVSIQRRLPLRLSRFADDQARRLWPVCIWQGRCGDGWARLPCFCF